MEEEGHNDEAMMRKWRGRRRGLERRWKGKMRERQPRMGHAGWRLQRVACRRSDG